MISRRLLLLMTIAMLPVTVACGQAANTPLLQPNSTDRYNLQIDTRGNHLSGILIARPTPDGPRIVTASYLGPTIFDFSMLPDSMRINSCVQPMRRKAVLQLLECDLRNTFCSCSAKLRHNRPTEKKYVTGHLLGRSVFVLYFSDDSSISRLQIRHPWIRLRLSIDPIEK